jgi:hypothetical protein
MPYFTIKTKDAGLLEFSVPNEGGYVKLDGSQICYGGGFFGETISCTPSDLPKVARKWNAQRRRYLKELGL